MFLSLLAELPQWLETLAMDIQALWPIVLAVGAFYGVIRWLSNKFKTEVKSLICEEMAPLKAEFQNNGGASLKDAIDRLEKNMDYLKSDLDNIKMIQQKHDQVIDKLNDSDF